MSAGRSAAVAPAVFVVLLALFGPIAIVGSVTAPIGGPFLPPGEGHLLGTDVLGRDVLARVLAGGRTLVLQAIFATMLGSLVGLSIGIWAGTAHRARAADVMLRIIDGIAAVPALLLLLLLAAGLPGDDAIVAVAIAFVSVPFSVRVTHERTRQLAATDYAREAHARGEARMMRVRFDILPGLIPVALAEAGIRFVAATQLAATAGFLGLGAAAPAANWGRMVRENSTGLSANPFSVVVPALLLVVLAVGAAAATDRLATTRLDASGRIGRAA